MEGNLTRGEATNERSNLNTRSGHGSDGDDFLFGNEVCEIRAAKIRGATPAKPVPRAPPGPHQLHQLPNRPTFHASSR